LYIRASFTSQDSQKSVDLEPHRVLYIRASQAPQDPDFPSEHRDLYIRASGLEAVPP
jgi:hypothetical protein